jgi:signal transduction histidine kinase
MGSILVTFGGIAYHTEVNDELGRLDRLLQRSATVMVASIRYRFENGEWRLILDHVPLLGNRTLTVNSEIIYARWYDESGNLRQFLGSPLTQQRSPSVGFETRILGDVEQWEEELTIAQPQGDLAASTPVRQLTAPVYRDDQLLGYLQVAIPLTPVQDNLDGFRLFLSVTIPVSMGMIGVASWFFGRLATRPIQQAHTQLERFTSDASHELRTPLSAILSNAQVGLLASPNAEQRYRLQNIVETTKSMNSLVDQLLVLARHTEAIAPQHLTQLNLSEWIQPLIETYQQITHNHELAFKTETPVQPIWVCANSDLLTQAIKNLLHNAVKYTPSRGHILLKLSVQSRMAVIEVKDDGPGIAEQDLPYIFDRFYRVDPERSPQAGGFGLGLAIAQKIVEAHGGKITVSSTLHVGSVFQVKLPLASKSA